MHRPLCKGQGQPQQPQQPPITFRAEVNYVEVDTRVLDRDGKFVAGLTASDFQVFEDGKPQKVSAFSMVNIPLERAERPLFASKPVEPDVRTNLQGADGRIYVIMLDDLHTAPLRSQRIKMAAKQFIERYVGANDLAAVVHTSGRSDAGQEFTTSQSRLLRAVDKFMGRKLNSSTRNMMDDAQMRSGTPMAGDPVRDIDDKERGFNARGTLDSIRNVANYLGNIRGRRKALVMFGEGIDYNINEMFSNTITEAQTVIDATRDMIAAATRANVAIFAVDPRGLGASVLAQNAVRAPDLVPIRHGRMAASPWTYYRGAAAVMAADLASRPDSGLTVQLCGDAHVLNFGLWATPERQLSFDLRDFDETLPGPVRVGCDADGCEPAGAGPRHGADEREGSGPGGACRARRVPHAGSRGYAEARFLDIWYAQITAEDLLSVVVAEERADTRRGSTSERGSGGTPARRRSSPRWSTVELAWSRPHRSTFGMTVPIEPSSTRSGPRIACRCRRSGATSSTGTRWWMSSARWWAWAASGCACTSCCSRAHAQTICSSSRSSRPDRRCTRPSSTRVATRTTASG